MNDLLSRVRREFPTTSGIVVGVSGGADSVALLAILHELRVAPITAAHVNHGLRGAESDGDEAFVGELAARLSVPFRSARVTVDASRNIEANARQVRYRALARIAQEVGASHVVTGHTADDQAETVLHRVIRGAGLGGLAGVLAKRKLGSFWVVRPLLGVRRQELRDYLSARGLLFREDSSNLDPRFTRNRLRAELMPVVESFNSRAVEQLCRLAGQATVYQGTERRRASKLRRSCELPSAGGLRIFDAAKLAALSEADLALVWRSVWRRERWPRGDMGAREWRRLAEFCSGDESAIDLPGGIRARRVGRVVRVGPGA